MLGGREVYIPIGRTGFRVDGAHFGNCLVHNCINGDGSVRGKVEYKVVDVISREKQYIT